MSSPLIERLTTELGYPRVDTESLNEFLDAHAHSVLFFAGDPAKYPEANDVAVVLPELVRHFAGRLAPALVADEDEARLQALYGFESWPALVFLRGREYLGSICRIRDWSDYLQTIEALLQGPPKRPPSVGIPVVSA
ncbi:MAG: hydrogenase-1 expression HyaE [Chromatiales bacterium]|nr:hydrogenase-1 expression HyaE [Chromatiales bacterium]